MTTQPGNSCDFCHRDNEAAWSFPCRDFEVTLEALDDDGTVTVQPVRSNGPWLACDPCRTLIESGDRDLLAIRCARFHCKGTDPHSGELLQTVFDFHDAFRHHRQGRARPYRAAA